jgi:hypothetical protein
MRTAVWTGGVLPLVLMLALSGCGSGTSGGSGTAGSGTAGGLSTPASSSSATVPSSGGGSTGASSPAKSASGAAAAATAVATVEATPIAQATFAHWLAVTAALSGQRGRDASVSNTALKDRVMGFLITGEWVLGEAAAQGIEISEAAAHKRLEEVQKRQFKQPGELQKYLAKDHETAADLLLRVKLELIESAISRKVTAAKHTSAEKKAALASFQSQFQAKWKAKTRCTAGYVTEGDCGKG